MPIDRPLVSVTLHLRIHDEGAFGRAARTRAIADGVSASEANAYLLDDGAGMTLDDCAAMLLDPGASPDGGEILASSTETRTCCS